MNSPTIEADFSIYTLRHLLEARYWVDAKSDSSRGRYLEKEIQKRCAYIREQTNPKPTAAAGSGARFRPKGLIFGVVFLACSSGPFVAAQLLYLIDILRDANGDLLFLSGVWALLTLPFAVLGFMIGGIRDAGHVVKWFDLAGRTPIS
jgi:hypothetical protein